MREAFVEVTFRPDSLQTIATVNAIIGEYQADGYTLTLRQLYYQMVARGFVENSLKSYKRLGDVVNNGRLAGLIDWAAIEDRGRETVANSHWRDPAEIVAQAARQFAIDKWADQPSHVEVMVEKQALEGVLIPVCRDLDIPFTANRGYSSSSALYEAGKRIARFAQAGKEVFILYLGDHDPSGIDMTRDVRDRATMFAGVEVEVKRLALNFNQVEEFNPPPNPAKMTDARANAYVLEFGSESWELDAIEPRRLAAIVTQAVEALIDPDRWAKAVARETDMKADLRAFANSYSKKAGRRPAKEG